MKNLSNYSVSIDLAVGLDATMDDITGYEDYARYMRIREEMNRFLLNVNQSGIAATEEKQAHFLFVALIHLDNMEKEIAASAMQEEVLNMGRIYEKIRSLKTMIQAYIKDLT